MEIINVLEGPTVRLNAQLHSLELYNCFSFCIHQKTKKKTSFKEHYLNS